MSRLDSLIDSLPEVAKDIRLNLRTVLEQSSLDATQRWGVAVAVAASTHHPELRDAVVAEARERAGEAAVDDGLAAATLMAMNNVYYRFRHMIEKPTYGERPARLRMTRIARPATTKGNFELMCLAVSAVNGCAACLVAHEHAVLEEQLTEDQVHDAVRIAASLAAAAVGLEVRGVATSGTVATSHTGTQTAGGTP